VEEVQVHDGHLTSCPSWRDLQQASDIELIRYWVGGNHDAFAVVVDRYQRLVFSVAVRIVKDQAEAEDVVQIVFLRVDGEKLELEVIGVDWGSNFRPYRSNEVALQDP
jgi:sigma-70-like protein